MATKKTASALQQVAAPKSEMDRWQAEEDVRTLARAEEIRNDPKRLAAAKKMAASKLAELQAVAGTK